MQLQDWQVHVEARPQDAVPNQIMVMNGMAENNLPDQPGGDVDIPDISDEDSQQDDSKQDNQGNSSEDPQNQLSNQNPNQLYLS